MDGILPRTVHSGPMGGVLPVLEQHGTAIGESRRTEGTIARCRNDPVAGTKVETTPGAAAHPRCIF